MTTTSTRIDPLDMLTTFTVRNSRSWRDEATLSMLAAAYKPSTAHKFATTRGEIGIVPAAGIFGANASGKTALLRSMSDLRSLVVPPRHGFYTALDRSHPTYEEKCHPFALVDPGDTERNASAATCYDINVVLGGVPWDYGVELDAGGVLREYAYHYPKGRRAVVFERERTDSGRSAVTFGPPFRSKGRYIQMAVEANQTDLVVTLAGLANAAPLSTLYAWFRRNLDIVERDNLPERVKRFEHLVNSPEIRDRCLAMLRGGDLGIRDVGRDPTWNGRPDDAPMCMIHEAGGLGSRRVFVPLSDESLGTLAWVGLIPPLIETLHAGGVLLVDELDSSIHHRLVHEVVDLFQRQRRNPNAAQLIFNTHDVSLLGRTLGSETVLRRDQVWFADKYLDGASTLTALTDFDPRYDEAIERRYRAGRYGGMPQVNPADFVRATEPLAP